MNIVDLKTKKTDFEIFKKEIENSRVVALGECAHFVRQFWGLRQYLFEYLHEKCGFSFFAMEFGFAEGYRLEKWIKSEGDINKLSEYSEAAAKWGALETMRWLRENNKANNNTIRFAGIDIPEAGGTIIPALSPLQAYIKKVDNTLETKLIEITEIASSFSYFSSVKSIAKWKNISFAEQHKLFVELNKIRLCFEVMKSDYIQLSGQEEYDIAFRLLETAITTVYILSAVSAPELPAEGSIENFLVENGYKDILTFISFQNEETEIRCFRSQSAYINTSSIKETFNGMFSIPQISLDKTIEF